MDAKQSLTITKLETGQSDIKYAIDFPRSGLVCDTDSIYIGFSGWIVSLDGAPINFVFSHMPEANFIPNRERADVKNIFPGSPLLCGARYPIDYKTEFKIGASLGGKTYWLAQASISKPKAKALIGGQGHLFLSNDTNNSINQFIGKTLISDGELKKWGSYFKVINSWSERSGTPFTFMLAPAKEYIYPEYYPEKKASITPVEQFTILFSKQSNLLNPEIELSRDKEFTYFKTDSHWNDYGASVAATAFCRSAGFVYTPPNTEFVIKQLAGDLGSKLIPIKTESALMVGDREKLTRHKIFENNLAARGNIVVYENPGAANQKCLMIFGDSFSTSLANCLSHSFKRVVKFFSGADVDWRAVDSENPDHILIELTSRFLIRAPNTAFSISDEIKRKYAAMDAKELETHIQFLKSQPSSKRNYHVAACREAMNAVAATKSAYTLTKTKG